VLRRLQSLNSLQTRLLLAAALTMTTFALLGGIALEHAFRSSLLQAQEEKLQGLVYALLGAASPDDSGDLTIALEAIPDPRLRQPLSGLTAALFDEGDRVVWSSAAFLPMPTPRQAPAVGEWRLAVEDELRLFSLSFGLRWIGASDTPRRYTVVVLEDRGTFDRQMAVYRRILWGWLGATIGALSVVLAILLRWGLSPLKRLGRELQQIENGERTRIEGHYPRELEPLTRDLNAMIVNERQQQTRYRNALGDLTHTLKTPLAVLRGLTEDAGLPSEHRAQLDEQVARMQHIVNHQLRRAAAAGSRTLTEPVALRPICDKLIATLTKVYAGRDVRFDNWVVPTLRLRADQGDLFELIGNLLDNAAKYGHGHVRLSATLGKNVCNLVVEDNGMGLPDHPESLLERGARADRRQPGQGLGLAAVVDIVKAYEGQLKLDASPLGGAKITATLPLH
jgi:two-component system sensor histidine kinase PhoQ